MMHTNEPHTLSTQITLKEAIFILRAYFYAILSKWYLFVIFPLLVGGFVYYKKSKLPILYTAKASFMTTKGGGGGSSGLLQLAGRFGFNTGGGGKDPSEKIVELLRTQKMMYAALFKETSLNGKSQFIINHYIDCFQLHKEWKGTASEGYYFPHADVSKFTLLENSQLKRIYRTIEEQFFQTNSSENGIIYIATKSESESFSLLFTHALLTTVTDYYVQKSIQQQQSTFNLIQSRVDSVENALYESEYALANWIQTNRIALRAGSLNAHKLLEQERRKRKAEILAVMYEEGIKNREIAYMNLQTNTPLIQIIDLPSLPLNITYVSKLVPVLMAVIGLSVALTILIAFQKLIRDALNAEN